LFRELFYDVVRQAKAAGLVGGKELTVDATTVGANASMGSLERIVVELEPSEYMGMLESEERAEKKKESGVRNSTHRSRSDPDARIHRKRGGRARLAYSDNVLMDNAERVIVDVEVSQPQPDKEGEAAADMVKRSRFKVGINPESIIGDGAYGTGETLRRLFETGVAPYVPERRQRSWVSRGIFGKDRFRYDAEADELICPGGKRLKRCGELRAKYQTHYMAEQSDCSGCSLKRACTRAKQRVVGRHWDQEYIERARELRGTSRYRLSQRSRKKIEQLFGEAKEQMGLRRAHRRGYENMTEQALMTAMVQNIKRIVAARDRHLPKVTTGAFGAIYGAVRSTICRTLRILWLQDYSPIISLGYR
jgi:hypothetical protein